MPAELNRQGPVALPWRVLGSVSRAAFLIVVAIVTLRFSLPDTLDAGTLAHSSIADFARAAIGVAIAVFLLVELFRRPKDEHGYKAWTYIGLALCAVLAFVAIFIPGLLTGVDLMKP
jgi:hypothetical protein